MISEVNLHCDGSLKINQTNFLRGELKKYVVQLLSGKVIIGCGPVCGAGLRARIFEILSNGIKWSLLPEVASLKEVKMLPIIDGVINLENRNI